MNFDRDSPTLFLNDQDEPGDRFIPTRSLMDMERAQCSLRGRKKDTESTMAISSAVCTVKEEYKRIITENLVLDSEGKPFRMLVFKGSPRTAGRRLRLLDEMMMQENGVSNPVKTFRRLPKSPDRILDAPDLVDDYYLNLVHWGRKNILAVALGSMLYLWNAENGKTQQLLQTKDDDYLTAVRFSDDGKTVAVGLSNSQIQLWDVAASRQVRSLGGHLGRVGSLAWNNHLLTSGSRDTRIINHDVRASRGSISCLRVHCEEVCGLRWSGNGNQLASGGNDNLLYIWDASNMASSGYLHRLDDHQAAVKALAWCPFHVNILASGGGTADRCIKMWNSQTGQCLSSVDTQSQVCALEWNSYHKEILSSHGFIKNQVSVWRYPSMTKLGELTGHSARVLHLSQSPDGSTVVSAGADETLRFWKLFKPPQSSASRGEENTSPLSLKSLHIR